MAANVDGCFMRYDFTGVYLSIPMPLGQKLIVYTSQALAYQSKLSATGITVSTAVPSMAIHRSTLMRTLESGRREPHARSTVHPTRNTL